jgi:hypothetical protein
MKKYQGIRNDCWEANPACRIRAHAFGLQKSA